MKVSWFKPRAAALSATLLTLVLFVPAASAGALVYASSNSPQYVTGHGSVARSYGSWDAYKSSSASGSKTVRSHLPSAHYRYTDADDHTVYVSLNTSIPYHPSNDNHTSHDNRVSASWTAFRSRPNVTLYVDASLKRSVAARAAVSTCLDIPLRFDPCSNAKSLSKNVAI